MSGIRILSTVLAVSLGQASGAFAGSNARVYSSTTLVLAFVGFLALIVVIQLIPAVMTLIGAFREIAGKGNETAPARAETGE